MYNVPTINAERNHNLAFWLWMLKSIVTPYFLSLIITLVWLNGPFKDNFAFVSTFSSLFQATVNVVVEWLIIRYFFPTMRRWLSYTWLIMAVMPFVMLPAMQTNQALHFMNVLDSLFGLPFHRGRVTTLVLLTIYLPIIAAAAIQSWLFRAFVDRPFRWLLAMSIATTIMYLVFALDIYNRFQIMLSLDVFNYSVWMINIVIMLLTSLLPALVLRQFVIERKRASDPV